MDNPQSLFQQAKPVYCGNTWETLSGEDTARKCLECNRNVYNLAELTQEQLKQVRQTNPGRMCVVFDNSRLLRFFSKVLVKAACPVLPLMLLVQLSQLAMAMPPEPDVKSDLRSCTSYMYVPMMVSAKQACLDENGKPSNFRDFMNKEVPQTPKSLDGLQELQPDTQQQAQP